MKDFLSRLLLAIAVTLAAFFFASLAHAQQADEDPAPATPQQHQPQATAPSSQQQASKPSGQKSSDQKNESSNSSDQTQDALAFTGRVGEEKGECVLYDPVTKMTYQLDDAAKAKPYMGKQVKIVGKLEMKSNTIRIDNIDVVH